MAARTALACCRVETEGAWSTARGNERAIKIVGLTEGEYVQFVAQVGDLNHHEEFTKEGVFPLPKQLVRYRVGKRMDAGVRGSPTTVEILLDAP